MKKLLCTLISGMLIIFAFIGCTNNNNAASYKDGTYKAQFASADDHGWTEYIEITVSSGKITEAVVDAKNIEGEKKSQSEVYDKAMKDAGAKTWPSKFYPELESQITDKQNGEMIDGVAGATNSSDTVKTLYKALKGNMEKGDTNEVIVERP